jgi:hypothetical protein
VRDYVQLDFDGMLLTAYTLPEVEAGGRRWSSREPGWRDSLCQRIGVSLTTAYCSELQLALGFSDTSNILISLRDQDYTGPEAFMLCADDHPAIVV